MDSQLLVVNGSVVAATVGAWLYFRRFHPARPPVGVFNRVDVLVMLAGLVAVPYLYLVLPAWMAAVFLAIGMASILTLALQPILRRAEVRWAAVAVLMVGDVVLALGPGSASRPFMIVNNLVLVGAVVGTSAFWAQSGMRAADLALLVVGVTVYDVFATTQASVMAKIFTRLSAVPFVPLVRWGDPGHVLSAGLGDLLVAAVFPLVMRKAFGRKAGLLGLASGLAVIVAMLSTLYLSQAHTLIPAMVVLGPLLLAQIGYWRSRAGAERPTREYLLAEPLPVAVRRALIAFESTTEGR
jgi:hypothetical protein